ncbi:RNase P modulator RnpM [Facklamia sp. 7083-14-GEN3]|uniref:RNase P modulator RnpM n=1 Tax=Facklamia sp. 7083-14-GEN3 TaxID=2973478 RepID=UPI00215D1F71|nr:YlxR family protein [Facklamia sp. 7083-14-GEN3]MCR8968793.1 YlxR family protein [Facklamia sp. 7083-14-GEN3]
MSQAKKRKIPMRKCVVTGESHPKKDLIRIVRTPEGSIEIDPTGKKNGRGAYIALDPELALQAEKKKVFNRTFETEIDKEFYQELYRFLDHQKARKELL